MGFTVSYSAVTWTAGDVLTEAKLDNMVANDQAYDSHSAQGFEITEMAKPSTPASNKIRIYAKDKGGISTLYCLKDDAVEVALDNLKRVNTSASASTHTINSDTTDLFTVTAQAEAVTFAEPSGTPVQGQSLIIRVKDNATARAITWNAIFRASSDLALPTTTILSKTLYCGFMYNSTDSKWDLLAYLDNI